MLLLDTKPPPDLEAIFFDLETEMEKNLCRDAICLSDESERRECHLLDEWRSFINLLYPVKGYNFVKVLNKSFYCLNILYLGFLFLA